MPVCRDIPVTVNVEKLLRYEGNTDHGMIVETASWAAETAVKLSKPAIAYRYLPAEIAGKQLNVCGVFLQIGPVAPQVFPVTFGRHGTRLRNNPGGCHMRLLQPEEKLPIPSPG